MRAFQRRELDVVASHESRYKRLVREEAGQALAIALIAMIFGGLVMIPFLLFASAGLQSSAVTGENVQAYYAADAGVEDAIWKVRNGDLSAMADLSTHLTQGVGSVIRGVWMLAVSIFPGAFWIGFKRPSAQNHLSRGSICRGGFANG